MAKTDASHDRASNRLHNHYQEWFTGDGATTEFRLQHTIGRPEDVAVYVNRGRLRPADKGAANDFQIRGHTPGYAGDRNAIRCTVAPPGPVGVCVDIIST